MGGAISCRAVTLSRGALSVNRNTVAPRSGANGGGNSSPVGSGIFLAGAAGTVTFQA
jgi:hypothetical protein